MPPAPAINGPVFSKLCLPPLVSGAAAKAELDPMEGKVYSKKTRARESATLPGKGQLHYYYYYKAEL